ncbi:hypothetical protein BCR44DRAFT_1460543 [Catenaria anguillulae PL171]|uniref:Uncharacterized protein n=1 Tax=Catenaria anguillulae PL171 TaxID=765915 RepID=A0A1Y2HNI6_9FUNG|nr:hypothetical protein BCR44DRAFT_1460543 [Catenaria anguillulae PL171]
MTAAKSSGPVPGAIRPAAGIKSHGTANQLTFLESSIFSVAYAVANAEELLPTISWLLALPWIGAIFAPVRWLSDYRAFSAVNVLGMLDHENGRFIMPILFLFIGGLNCVADSSTRSTVQCTASPHIALLVFNVLGLVVFVPMFLICSLVLIDTNPKSENPLARAHGQVDLTASCIRVLLVALGIFLPSVDTVSLWVYNALTVILLGYLASRYILRQPYFNLSANMAPRWTVALGGTGLGFMIGAGAAKWFSSHVLTRTVGYWHEVVRREMEEQNLASPSPIGKTTASSVQRLVEKQAKDRKSDSSKLSSKGKKSKSSVSKPSKDKSPPVIEVNEHEEQKSNLTTRSAHPKSRNHASYQQMMTAT